ncbi:MAG TPA: peptide ligase PGM1-related protein [Steroidobacteraceae bacterium]|nr:peptide ligase PGM1-related protein [Steroidobacteraceae bacterium]
MNEYSPAPGSAEELARFAGLQARLKPLFRDVYCDPRAPRTVVIVPGLSMDQEVISRIEGLPHYEERQLTMLMLLRLPNTRIVFVTSTPISPAIIDYYLNLLPGIPHQHARRRLVLLSAYDGSPVTLTEKILERPRLLARIREAIGEPSTAHLSCFNATTAERTLAVQLGIPLYACDPALGGLGSKSGSRKVFREAQVATPEGFEDLRDMKEVAEALATLRQRLPDLACAVIKLNDGAGGEGNATLSLTGAPEGRACEEWIREALPRRAVLEAPGESWEHYAAKFAELGGIVEAWIAGNEKSSPSVQLRVSALGELEIISTHDQVLGGPTGQRFLGSIFPAADAYRLQIQAVARRVGAVLERHGVLGRFGVDFVCVRQPGGWDPIAIEINLRKGGTTHTFQTLQYLTGGQYDAESGLFRTPSGQARYYYATDNLTKPAYRRLLPEDLIDIAVEHDLHFDQTIQQGVTFNLIGALSEFGKLGVVSIADSVERASEIFERTVTVLDQEAGRTAI